MKFSHIVAAAAVALCASQAGAQTLTSIAAPMGDYTAISGLTGSFATYSADITDVATRPLYDFGTYSVVTVGSPTPTATLTFGAGVKSFTFLWGSPDAENKLFVDGNTSDVTFTGTSAFAGANGSNANTRLVTITDEAGLNSLTFSTTKIAFEVAQVSAVPEPETYALMLAGLGAIGFVARRRKSA